MTTTSTAAHQASTLATATRHGAHWTQAELDTVRSATKPLADLAVQLGRSLYAVTSARQVIDERAERAAKTIARELPYDRGFVDIEALFAD